MIRRIKKSINRLFRFYGNAINWRIKYKYNFFKYSLKIPVKFIYTSLKNEKAGKDAIKRLGIMESPIKLKKGKTFYAIDISMFFEQFVEHIYEIFPEFHIKKGWIIIDCGAAAGEYTLYALKKGAIVYAIEPHKKAFEYLRKNVGHSKKVTTYNKELSNINKGKKVTLDKLFKEIGKIDILKIDIEGDEVKALKGAEKTLKKTKRVVLEVHTKKLMKKCKEILSPDFDIRISKVNPDDSQPLLYAIKKN